MIDIFVSESQMDAATLCYSIKVYVCCAGFFANTYFPHQFKNNKKNNVCLINSFPWLADKIIKSRQDCKIVAKQPKTVCMTHSLCARSLSVHLSGMFVFSVANSAVTAINKLIMIQIAHRFRWNVNCSQYFKTQKAKQQINAPFVITIPFGRLILIGFILTMTTYPSFSIYFFFVDQMPWLLLFCGQ